MKSKKLICVAVAAALTLGVSGAALTGCISTNNEEDVKQVVATVDITKSEAFKEELGSYASSVKSKDILKRDLIAGFVSVGSTYINQYSMSYEDTFNTILDGLVANEVVAQYATATLLKKKVDDGDVSLDTFNQKAQEGEKEMYEYLLGEEEVKKAQYAFKSSLNDTLDSYERRDLEEENGYTGSETRTAPADVDTLKDGFVPEEYGVYTGYQGYLLEDAGEAYEPLNGTNRNTRRKAYASFVGRLRDNYLLTEEDKQTTDILELSYVQYSYVDRLQQQVVEEFSSVFEKEQEAKVLSTDDDGVYTYVKAQYDGVDGEYTKQQNKYQTISDFETDMGNVSDTSFILYSPATKDTPAQGEGDATTYGTYGYVYNILLPFTTMQSVELKNLQGRRDAKNISESEYFASRNDMLKNIYTTDQRAAWFNGSSDYSFNAAEYNEGKEESAKLDYFDGGNTDRKYLFFENNLTDTAKYEALDKYAGMYTYNGKVAENKDGSYKLVANKLDIDGMLYEFTEYINFVLGTDSVKTSAGDKYDPATAVKVGKDFTNAEYYGTTDFTTTDSDTEIDYSKLIYATGKVDFGSSDATSGSMFIKDGARYKAMCAVNELQYAYTTDTGVLSQYIGYTVSAYETSYIKEFEYAAQQALRSGAGTFKVCAGDYGWHLLYVTESFSFEGGEVYKYEGGYENGPHWTEEYVTKEGTFENRFYEWVKDSAVVNAATRKRADILKKYNGDETVETFKDTYKDLTNIKN